MLYAQADHLLLSTIVITPDSAEMVIIKNPTDSNINLDNYYLTDATSTTKQYYNIVSGDNYWSSSPFDFFVNFPNVTLLAGDSLFVGLSTADIFYNYYGFNCDISLGDADTQFEGDIGTLISITGNALDNTRESLILFHWDGVASIVQDVDYFLWNEVDYDASNPISHQLAIDKSLIEGYVSDTPVNNQIYKMKHEDSYAYVRVNLNENDEVLNDGNGITGHDETSEDFLSSWETVLSPGIVFGCTTDTATNYNQAANADDGSCFTSTHTIEQIVTSDPNSIGNGYQATIAGLVKSFDDIRPSGGPQVIVLEDENGFRIDAVIWDWDVLSSSIGYMFDVYDPSIYSVGALGTVGVYNNSFQFEISSENNIFLYREYHPEGNLVEDETIIKAEIVTAPYVIIPSLGERLDFSYSFPSNSRVIVRIIDLNGIFITSIVDRYYETGGVVERYEDTSDWDGRNHLGQIVNPGTYLIQVEASDFQTGRTTTDVAPIVVGVNH